MMVSPSEPTPEPFLPSERRVLWGILALSLILLLVLARPGCDSPVPASIETTADRDLDDQIDINRAEWAELVQLPGIGPRLADAIIAERSRSGPFGRIEDLDRVPGIGPAVLESVRPFLVWPSEGGSASEAMREIKPE